jgi:lipopolysaccharide export system protein LptC
MAVELHLPDLPEVPISLGPLRSSTPRTRAPWHLRLRDAISAYLPLLLMLLLALFTWWLVKNTPNAPGETAAPSERHEADYTMSRFALERFDAQGRLKVRIEGAQMRHFPDSGRYEIDDPQMRAIAPDGRITLASARRAISNGDASEVQLLGSARVTSVDTDGKPIEMSGEFLHAYLTQQRVHSHLPVLVTAAGNTVSAAGLDYDHGQRKLELQGPMRAVFPPRNARR